MPGSDSSGPIKAQSAMPTFSTTQQISFVHTTPYFSSFSFFLDLHGIIKGGYVDNFIWFSQIWRTIWHIFFSTSRKVTINNLHILGLIYFIVNQRVYCWCLIDAFCFNCPLVNVKKKFRMDSSPHTHKVLKMKLIIILVILSF